MSFRDTHYKAMTGSSQIRQGSGIVREATSFSRKLNVVRQFQKARLITEKYNSATKVSISVALPELKDHDDAINILELGLALVLNAVVTHFPKTERLYEKTKDALEGSLEDRLETFVFNQRHVFFESGGEVVYQIIFSDQSMTIHISARSYSDGEISQSFVLKEF